MLWNVPYSTVGTRNCKRCFATASRLCVARIKKPLQKSENSEIKEIAVIGAGITGLATAYFAASRQPKARITLFESSKQLGGWIRSNHHQVGGGTVVFEDGPRSLRPNPGTLALLHELDLTRDILITEKGTPAASNRYIYNHGRLVNTKDFTSVRGMLQETLVKTIIGEALKTFALKSRGQQDESIGDFFRRRGLPNTANDLISAVIHGIYAGDIDELSMDMILPSIVEYEQKFGSPLQYLFYRGSTALGLYPKVYLRNIYSEVMLNYASMIFGDKTSKLKELLQSTSIYTLQGGLETLVLALEARLRAMKDVKLVTEASIDLMDAVPNNPSSEQVRLTIRKHRAGGDVITQQDFDRVFSTVSNRKMSQMCPPLKHVFENETASTVAVVNLFYDQPDLLSKKGFGYLIPKSTPKEQNPEGALGVVFDTDATPRLDSVPGTKLTVMLGGPNWKDVPAELLPSRKEALQMAQAVLYSHLGISQKPSLVNANIHANCIPQYTVGYKQRMQTARWIMRKDEKSWKNHVRVLGSSYGGVGVNDCISQALLGTVDMFNKSFGGEDPYCWSSISGLELR